MGIRATGTVQSENLPHKVIEVVEVIPDVELQKDSPFIKAPYKEPTKQEREKLLQKTEKEEAEDKSKFEELQGIIYYKLIENNPRLESYPQILTLCAEIMMWRLENKKNKTGFLKCTINQITFGIDLSEKDLANGK